MVQAGEHQQRPKRTAPQCRDPNDQKFIDLAITAGAAALITRDNDLLSLKDQVPFTIIDETTFLPG